jgi:RNA polymerase sigma factor (sigma-70 family)
LQIHKEIGKYPPLPKAEEDALALRARAGDIEARNKLVCHNLKHAYREAKRYRRMGVEMADLFQEASMGMLYAASRYKPQGFHFSALGSLAARGRVDIQCEILARHIRIPARYVRSLHNRTRYGERFLTERECLWVGRADRCRTMSLEAEVDHSMPDDPLFLLDVLPSPDRTPEELCIEQEKMQEVRKAVRKLRPILRVVVENVWGLTGAPQAPIEVARQLGLTKSALNERKKRALKELRKLLYKVAA